MGEWAKKVAAAIRKPEVQNGIATLVARYSKEHIANSEGRGDGGNATDFAPLKDVKGQYWTTKRPKGGTGVKATRERVVSKPVKRGGKTVTVKQKVVEYLVEGESYRAGGKPLRDQGDMMRKMDARSEVKGGKIEIIMFGLLHAIFHEKGFETSGPNFIPLSKKARKKHATGGIPSKEGLTKGKDYLMAWNGVKVPARPFMVPTNDEWVEIGKSIRMGLARILKGRK